MRDADSLPDIVLCIPGPWRDRSELLERIADSGSGYLFAGRVLMHMQNGHCVELQHEARDDRMADAFLAAGRHWSHSPDMERIAAHASVVYLVGKGGSRENAELLMRAGQALLDAGGLGVKVESSGIAHTPDVWRSLCSELHRFSAFAAYVVFVTGSDVFSCGMHSLGLRDAVIESHGAERPVELLKVFTQYLLIEQPTILAGHTFSAGTDEPRFKLADDPGMDVGDNALFANPYGTWRLLTT